jgi:ribosome-interacting GTPase 1
MPANLSPEYKSAEQEFRRAREPAEKLRWLREMLRTIPKHKGTDHLQADIKSRIKQLSDELAGPRKGGARTGPVTVIHPEGAAQVALVGPPNSGKSALHARLTGAHAQCAAYPFTTQFPQPGMLPFEDVLFQLVDLPAVSSDHPVPWLGNSLQQADACLLVLDLGHPQCLDQWDDLLRILRDKRVYLSARWPGIDAGELPDAADDPFAATLPTLLVANKADRFADLDAEISVFRELSGCRYPAVAVSVATGRGLSELGAWLFRGLGVVRVYTKLPGRPAEQEHPFTLRRGARVEDVARMIHKDLAETMKYARRWPRGGGPVSQVGREHPVEDGDLLEFHQ